VHEPIQASGLPISEEDMRDADRQAKGLEAYLATGDFIETACIDLVFPFDVSVHFDRALFWSYAEEIRRVLKTSGILAFQFLPVPIRSVHSDGECRFVRICSPGCREQSMLSLLPGPRHAVGGGPRRPAR
jgi:hypothetical protein